MIFPVDLINHAGLESTAKGSCRGLGVLTNFRCKLVYRPIGVENSSQPYPHWHHEHVETQ